MCAVARAILGPSPDAEDACHDAVVIALTRAGQLRDPAALGPWLKAIVRNNCRMMLRARRCFPSGLSIEGVVGPNLDPAQILELRAVRDWLWSGLEHLRPAVRTVAYLRWFTDTSSYNEIALTCDLPIGTVRSRLSEARKQLAVVLPRLPGGDPDRRR